MRSLALILTITALPVGGAYAQPAFDLRLIETEGGQAWLTRAQVMELAERAHTAGHCGGFFDLTNHPLPPLPRAASSALLALETRRPRQGRVVKRLLPTLSARGITESVKALSAFKTRYYDSTSGAEAALWVRDAFTRLAAGRKDVSVELFNHDFRQPSVIARIAGQGPHAQQKVVLGAHEDSINWEMGSLSGRAPGADDDASGVAVLLEVFKALTQADYRPQRTIEFMAYAGEELGLLGSQDIAESYRSADYDVVAALQMDMTMYPADTRKITFITDHVDPGLTHFAERLVDTYLTIPWQESRCGYACSDHASWERAGYPTVFPFETTQHAMNPDIHSDRDVLDNLDGDFGLQFAKLNTAFAVEMADGP